MDLGPMHLHCSTPSHVVHVPPTVLGVMTSHSVPRKRQDFRKQKRGRRKNQVEGPCEQRRKSLALSSRQVQTPGPRVAFGWEVEWQILVLGWFRIPVVHSVYTEVVNLVFPSKSCTSVWGAVRGKIGLHHAANFHFVCTLEICTGSNEISDDAWASHRFCVWMLNSKESRALWRSFMGH